MRYCLRSADVCLAMFCFNTVSFTLSISQCPINLLRFTYRKLVFLRPARRLLQVLRKRCHHRVQGQKCNCSFLEQPDARPDWVPAHTWAGVEPRPQRHVPQRRGVRWWRWGVQEFRYPRKMKSIRHWGIQDPAYNQWKRKSGSSRTEKFDTFLPCRFMYTSLLTPCSRVLLD